MIRKPIAIILVQMIFFHVAVPGAIRGHEVMYVGGTIGGLPEATEGKLDTSDPELLKFYSEKGSFEIPYEGVTSLEYGQKAGRRLGVAIAITVWALFSKKRKHFLTVGFRDADNQPQGVVLELPKGKPKSIITIIEARSGVKCEYESEEARKHVHG
ncbi:MAG TPA: hypothetical protein PLP42_08170 [Acidobacteriota bacterium]|nr:hypothetical protein [Acidobacteriota bacterium]